MKNKQQLLYKQAIYLGYLKVLNLKRIKLQTEINNYKKQIAFVKGTIMAMKNIKMTLNKESQFLTFFEDQHDHSRHRLKDIYIFLETSDSTSIGKYSDKKIVEFIKHNVRQNEDSIFIIGKRLFRFATTQLTGHSINLLGNFQKSTDKGFVEHFSLIFDKVSEISFTLYADNLVHKVILLYSDIKNLASLFQFVILPFDLKTVAGPAAGNDDLAAINNKEALLANRIFNDFKPDEANKITFISQVTSINESFLKLFLSSLAKYVVVNYLLNMALRRMLNFDEEEKNLEERMHRNRIELQMARNEAITNEMILTATARKIVTRKREEYIYVKREDEES